MKGKRFILRLMVLLLMAGGMVNSAWNGAWAASVTYHILTLPIDPSVYDYHMVDAVTGHRLEAFKVTVNNWSTVDMPSQYKSPLATGFTYYNPDDVTKSGSAIQLYTNTNTGTKAYYYDIDGSASPVSASLPIEGNTAEYYVIYTYNASNSIAQLDGSVKYNIHTKGRSKTTDPFKNKGFMALNRGRNNRPAVLPTANVDPEMLSSNDFMRVSVTGSGVNPYWSDANNKNDTALTKSRFFFQFKFEGLDPYHIVLRTAYAKDTTYIEENNNLSPTKFVYKWYKEGSLFAVGTANSYIASDEHIRYNIEYNKSLYPTNPTNLTEGEGNGYIEREGNWHGQKNAIWGTVALLPNYDASGYVFMGTRTVDGNGNTPASPYYLKEANSCNNLVFNQVTAENASNNLSIEGIYPIKKVTFKIATPFYKVEATDAHIISTEDWLSQYTVENDDIEEQYLPASLKRKYVTFTGKFYKDALCTQEITRFSQATEDPTEGYQVYIGYSVDNGIPFKAITPAASYSAATWANATWYELTDEGSTQKDGLKLKYDGANFKNNGADGEYTKTSEFAFIGDPYELQVVYRNTTSGGTVQYVGAAGTPPATETALTISTTATEGYKWELPNDATAGSFLLRKYKGTGNWYWNAGHPSPIAIDYTDGSHAGTFNVASANAQTVRFNVSNLTFDENYYLTVTVGGTNADQATVQSEKIWVYRTNTATFTVDIKDRGVSNKQFTLTIQEYNASDVAVGTPFVLTVNQNAPAYTANTVEYNTSSSTRVKVMTLPKHDFTYHIVDKSGRIAVKATANQTIFSPLSLLSLPAIIISPYIVDETVTFYTTYPGGGRGNLSGAITELTAGNAASATNVYVKYTTSRIGAKPIQLSEDEEFNVKLNDQYIYYDAGAIKSKANPTTLELASNAYLWKLRNRDPYAMLIDNLGAREAMSVTGTENVTVYDDNGGTTTESRQKGAWVKLAAALGNDVALTFDATRANAQPFVAKSNGQAGVYEVMVAEGGTLDASTTYYNIGRPEDNTIKIYNNSTYPHANDVLRFVLNQNVDYQYHLIDKASHLLLTASSKTPDMALPAEYQSPLVATYHFYDQDNMTIDEGTYTPIPGATELTSLSDLYATYTKTSGAYSSEWETGGKLTANDITDLDAKARDITSTGHFYYRIDDTDIYYDVNVTKARYYNIYVTYEANDIVNFNKSQYMLKFLQPFAEGYHLEDGNDKLTTGDKIQAVYPYCNGDGNLNIYGSAMQNEQFHGGASTRPRWVWYLDSDNDDPYHVRVRSRSTINYNGVSHSTYLTTYAVHFEQDPDPDTKHIVTGGTLPGIASTAPMEYMVLGTVGHYQLLTTDEINDGSTNDRRYVTSFEQYWKTYNMLKLCVLNLSKSTDNFDDSWVVPADKRSILEDSLVARGVGAGMWHSYEAYANATRWNGYNDKSSGHGSKVVEKLEHWYQTFDMGNGTFDIESGELPPVLVLLDRHGWEIMRRPLPPADTYPLGEELDSLRVYDSPLVDRYYFYSNATKASGCHKYTMRMQNGAERDQIKVNGVHYSSTSLGTLPPKTATGVLSGGAIQDFYVIYTVKEEYEKNYQYTLTLNEADSTYTEEGISQPYLMLQNGRFYKNENTPDDASKKNYISKPVSEYTHINGDVYDLIINPNYLHDAQHPAILTSRGNFIGNNFWYLKPNLNIDEEMGIPWQKATGENTVKQAKYVLKKQYKDKTGFDPYNLQIQIVNKSDSTPDGRYLTTHIDTVRLVNGILVGDYTGEDYYNHAGSKNVTLETEFSSYEPNVNKGSEDYDHTYLQISNQTFMAVSDANGNLQLMPRFDHTQRIHLDKTNPWLSIVNDPLDHAKASVDDNDSQGPQTTFFVCPKRFHYHIIDNQGREALRYKRGADFYPTITSHFKSPIAHNFTYHKTRPTYDPDTKTVILADTITGSFADAGYKDGVEFDVYVRYDYDAEADDESYKILQGPWFTVKLDNKDMKASGTVVTTVGDTQGTGVSLLEGTDKPANIDADEKIWQWKFLQAPTDPASEYYVKPDPYAIEIFNRAANYTADPSSQPSPMDVAIKVPSANDGANRFAILSHPSGGYALAVAKEYDNNYQYVFLNGGSMTTEVPATIADESTATFNYKFGEISDDAQILLNDEVQHTYTYNVITNAGTLAVSAAQTDVEADGNRYTPVLPEVAQSPLLNMTDYLYYGYATEEAGVYTVAVPTKLHTLYGLYDDLVYVRYKAYDMDSTSFKVPNKKTIVDSHVARDASSNDVAMNIDGGLPYNIIWYNDNIMQSNGTTVSDGGSHSLSGNEDFVWYFTGGDPYAMKIKHKDGSYANGTTTLVTEGSAPTFMMLRKEGYDYGILQLTGTTGADAGKKLTGFGGALTPDASTDPTKYIIFGLSIHKLIYHLIIAKSCADTLNPNADEYVDIAYRATESGTLTTKRIFGSTQRDLTSVNTGEGTHVAGEKYQLGSTISWSNPAVAHTYSFDAGSVSLGDTLILPNIFYRTNCLFDFYIEGIYRNYADPSNSNQGKPYTDLDNKYKGLKLGKLMSDELLIDQDVVVNVVYSFDPGLETNAGDDFVTVMKPAGSHYLWYTFETAETTPQLAHYTYVRGMRAEKGRDLHYTNDYLWSPLGDPYGFRTFNRYIYKNSGESTSVLTTATLEDGARVVMGNIADNDNRDIYELLPSANQSSGTFRVHPLLNTDNTLFLDIVESGDPGDIGKMILSDDLPAKEWTYGLNLDLLNPYYQGAGNIGGLTPDAKKRYEEAVADPDVFRMIRRLQRICYNKDSVIPYTPGYYRLYNQIGASSLSPVRYASGYLHLSEGDQNNDGDESDAIPMHFYSKAGVNGSFEGDLNPLNSGFTVSNATRGDIPVPATEYDASSIFYCSGPATGTTIRTQGLYVKGEETDVNSGFAKMTASAGSATSFNVADIGGAIVLVYHVDGSSNRHYINYNQADAAHKYDLQYFQNVPVDGSKWCMQPADTMGLSITTNNGGDGYYYATFYAPFDVLLPEDDGSKTYNAYTCSKWYDDGVHPKPVPATNDYEEGKFVPAETPVIIRVKDESGSVALSIPNDAPTTPVASNIFTGQHLEQLLAADPAHDVYTLGLPFTLVESFDRETGVVAAPEDGKPATTGIGFYINATENKEFGRLEELWQRNNRYVLHNKIYYRATGGSPAPERNAGPEFVPVLFGDEDQEQPGTQEEKNSRFDGGVYDLLGRKVADEQAAKDGTWRYRLSPGVYIVNGQKVMCSY